MTQSLPSGSDAHSQGVLYVLGWGGWGIAPATWAIIMVAAAVIVAALMAVTRRDIVPVTRLNC